MSLLPNIAPVVLDLILSRLVSWFLTATADPQAAREAASLMLASYDVQTEAEAHLAAEAICLSFGLLEALSRSVDPDLPLNAILRLRGSANAMHRSAHKSQRALETLRKQRQTVEAPAAAPPTDQIQALPVSQQTEPPKTVVLSRQQRRALERSQEKARRQLAEQARRDALRARRMDANPPQPAMDKQGSMAAWAREPGQLKPPAALAIPSSSVCSATIQQPVTSCGDPMGY